MDAHTIEILIATFGGTITILVGALVWALKYSMSTNKELAKKFDSTISNDLDSQTSALLQLTDAINKLCTMWENGR